MRVAAVQYRAERAPDDVSGALLRSRARLFAAARSLLARGPVDLLVLPEMAASGYLFPSRDAVSRVAEPEDGPTARAAAALARAHRCHVVVGFPEQDGDHLFNSAAVLDGHGELVAVYRKRLLYRADQPWATAGGRPYPVVDTGSGRFTVGICMDLNDDAFTGWIRDSGVEAVAFPTNWVDEGEPAWPYWAWRLQGSRAALVAANRWGSEQADGVMVEGPTCADTGVTRFSGASCVLQWRGGSGGLRPTVLAALPATGDGGIRARL
jgi:predicted amidohydrolase